DRQVHWRRPKVLADREDIGPLRCDVAHRADDFLAGLPEADHDPALADELGRTLLRATENLERTWVARLRPHTRIETHHGLDVVVQDLRSLGEHDVECRGVADEVRDEHLDRRSGRLSADLADGRGEE